MKKLLSIMLAALITLSCLAVPVYAEGPMVFELSPEDYVYGVDDTVTVQLKVENNTGMSAAIFYIDVPESLTPVGPDDWSGCVTLGPGFNGALPVSGKATIGDRVLSVAFMSLTNYTVDGIVFNISFKVNPDAKKTDSFALGLTVDSVSTPGGTYEGTDEQFSVKTPTAAPEITCTHPETEKVDAKPATCTEPGYTAGEKCKFCGEPIGKTQQTQPLGHDFQEDKVLEEATCEKVGKKQEKCSRCGETRTVDIPKKPHVESKDYKSDGTSHWLYCVNCNAVIEGTKEAHKPDTAWHNEDVSVDGHYHVCSVCKAAVGVEEHVDKDSDGVCDVCEAALHEHIADTEWKYDGEVHYHACTVPGCKAQLDKEAHKLETKTDKEATCTEKGSETTYCTVCEYKETKETEMIPHTPDTEWHTEKGSDMHWHICTVCGNKIEETAVAHTYGEYTSTETEHTHACTACGATETEKHSGGKATCVKGAICSACGKEYGELDPSNHADGLTGAAWENDADNHWQTCKNCGKTTEPEKHKESEDYKSDGENHWHYCTVCGYEFEKTAHDSKEALVSDSTGHWKVCDECGEKFGFDPHTGAVLTPEKAATAKEDGNMAYWYCPGCGKYFYDDNGKIGAGPYDNTDKFVTKYDVGCNGNHALICYPVNNVSHMYVCMRNCGFATTTSHIFGANGVCKDCGYTIATASTEDNVVDVEAPTEAKISVETVELVG